MNNTIKTALGVAIIMGIFLFGYAALQYVDSYSKSIQPSSFRSFSVTGEGKVVAIPDVAQFTLSVITQGGLNIEKLQRENVEKANGAIEFVKSKGVDPKDVKTITFQLEPRYQHFSCPERGGPCPPPEIVGYTIMQTVSVKIRDFTKIGEIFSGVVTKGANSVSQLSFTIDDPEEIQSEARTQAIQKAQEKAKSIAKAGDFRIGRLLSIQEGGYYPPPFYEYARGADLAPSLPQATKAPTIEPGSQEIKVNVTLVYEIE
ncbi:MAG: SIMPL domain-containing protein [Patescibacteria group bacterium]